MAFSGKLSGVDPTDLAGLREVLGKAWPQARQTSIGLSRVEIGPGALDLLPAVVSEFARGERIVLVTDHTPMRRNGMDLKGHVARQLGARFALERAVLGEQGTELHVDEKALAEAEVAVRGAGCVVVVGSGTTTDICKLASARTGGTPLAVVQTAASVNGFSDDLSVTLKAGVKRTVPSRWPDALLVDLTTLADAPPAMNAAGFGDGIAMWTSLADWYLASALGMDDSFHPAPTAVMLESGDALLDSAAALRRRDPEALDRLARVLTLGGVVMGVAGTTAILSGTEHLVSHLLDMAAGQQGRSLAFHGAQVGVATVLVAAAWEALLSDLDPAKVDVGACFPEPATMEPRVRGAFAGLDPTGSVGDECWSDYARKLERWKERREAFEGFLGNWSRHKAQLSRMVASPERLGSALAEAGAPVRFAELDPPVSPESVRWAVGSCHLMRNRFTLADLLFFLGWWDDAFVEKILQRARSVGGGL